VTLQIPEPRLVDAHAHICDAVFDGDRDEVLARARKAGVDAIIAVGEDLFDARRNLDLTREHPMLRAAAGLYPSHLNLDEAAEMAAFIRRNRSRLAAIGEVGLDYWIAKEDSERALQREILKTFIELSKTLKLPLNVHSRSAGRHAIALLLENDAPQVQMHAFDGKAGAALQAVEAGYFFSIPPSVVRSRQKQKLVRQLPISCLLIESDSPVLGPLPQERNEPANIRAAIKAIAKIKAIAEEEVVAAVSENTRRLYGRLVNDPNGNEYAVWSDVNA
jgi:TatD DNase family protein